MAISCLYILEDMKPLRRMFGSFSYYVQVHDPNPVKLDLEEVQFTKSEQNLTLEQK